MTRYSDSQEESSVQWSIEEGKIHFRKLNSNKIKFNSNDLIRTALYYANEIERIA